MFFNREDRTQYRIAGLVAVAICIALLLALYLTPLGATASAEEKSAWSFGYGLTLLGGIAMFVMTFIPKRRQPSATNQPE